MLERKISNTLIFWHFCWQNTINVKFLMYIQPKKLFCSLILLVLVLKMHNWIGILGLWKQMYNRKLFYKQEPQKLSSLISPKIQTPHRYRAFLLLQPSEMAFFWIWGRKTEKIVKIDPQQRRYSEKAKRYVVFEWVSLWVMPQLERSWAYKIRGGGDLGSSTYLQ